MTTIARDSNATPIQALRPTLPTTRLAITSSAQEVPRLRESTTIVRVVCDTDCWVRVGSPCTPDNGAYLPASLVEYFSLARDHQLWVCGSTGSCYVSEMS